MTKALIIIDMVLSNMDDVYNRDEIISCQKALIKEFKKYNLSIIVVTGKQGAKINPVMQRLWGVTAFQESKKEQLLDHVKGIKGSKLIKKTQYDAFFKTDLEEYCKNENIDELYCTGVFTGVCVYFTAASAAFRQIQPYLVVDACSAETKDQQVKATDEFGRVIGPLITTKELIDTLKHPL